MKRILILIIIASGFILTAREQDTTKYIDPPLVFFGSVDTYYKYDFSGHNNIPTSFAGDQNSVSIGMLDLGLKKKINKASFGGELSFCRRGLYQSTPNGDGTTADGSKSFHSQKLCVGYGVTDKFKVTAG